MTTRPQSQPAAPQAHTPTPWTLSIRAAGNAILLGPDNEFIANWAQERVEDRANALFVTRACNSHDALVAALRSIADDTMGVLKAREVARAALAAAGEA